MKLWTIGIIGLMLLLLVACIPITGQSGDKLKEINIAPGTMVLMSADAPQKATQAQVKAMVKGSIYETGEQVSLFGTCLNATDEPVTTGNVSAILNSWYPNGTHFINMTLMTEMQPGYFVYIAPMEAVQGTYLTELLCTYDGLPVAKAWGEWQNPMWVAKIAVINSTVAGMNTILNQFIADTAVNLSSISKQIDDVYFNLTNQLTNLSVSVNTSVLEEMVMNASLKVDMLYLMTQQGFFNTSVAITDLNNTFVVGLQNLTDQYQIITDSLLYISGQINSSQTTILLNLTLQLDGIRASLQNITGIIMQNHDLLVNLTNSVATVNQGIGNLSVQIGDLSLNMSNSFGITWDMLNSLNMSQNASFYNITQQLLTVINVANGSVDRNDSYLAIILRLLAYTEGAPVTRVLNWTLDPDRVHYDWMWSVKLKLINEYGNQIAGPIATCLINTTNSVSTVNGVMTVVGLNGNDPHGWNGYNGNPYYYWEEKIGIPPGGNFNWTVACSYN